MEKFSWAVNTTKLRRIMDKMPNATHEELRAEYVKQGGLVVEVDNTELEDAIVQNIYTEEVKPKKTVAKKVKEAVKKAVKKATK